MAHWRRDARDRAVRYDREMRYDRGFRGRSRYGASYEVGPAPRMGLGAEFGPPLPFPFGYDPSMGPLGAMAPMGLPYVPPAPRRRYDESFHREHPPRMSPAYGRGGDRALRAWADRFGYDVEFSIPPRRGPRRP